MIVLSWSEKEKNVIGRLREACQREVTDFLLDLRVQAAAHQMIPSLAADIERAEMKLENIIAAREKIINQAAQLRGEAGQLRSVVEKHNALLSARKAGLDVSKFPEWRGEAEIAATEARYNGLIFEASELDRQAGRFVGDIQTRESELKNARGYLTTLEDFCNRKIDAPWLVDWLVGQIGQR